MRHFSPDKFFSPRKLKDYISLKFKKNAFSPSPTNKLDRCSTLTQQRLLELKNALDKRLNKTKTENIEKLDPISNINFKSPLTDLGGQLQLRRNLIKKLLKTNKHI